MGMMGAVTSMYSAENLSFKDFVQVDLHLGGTTASNVEVLTAKLGNISTGSGNDMVIVKAGSARSFIFELLNFIKNFSEQRHGTEKVARQ